MEEAADAVDKHAQKILAKRSALQRMLEPVPDPSSTSGDQNVPSAPPKGKFRDPAEMMGRKASSSR